MKFIYQVGVSVFFPASSPLESKLDSIMRYVKKGIPLVLHEVLDNKLYFFEYEWRKDEVVKVYQEQNEYLENVVKEFYSRYQNEGSLDVDTYEALLRTHCFVPTFGTIIIPISHPGYNQFLTGYGVDVILEGKDYLENNYIVPWEDDLMDRCREMLKDEGVTEKVKQQINQFYEFNIMVAEFCHGYDWEKYCPISYNEDEYYNSTIYLNVSILPIE